MNLKGRTRGLVIAVAGGLEAQKRASGNARLLRMVLGGAVLGAIIAVPVVAQSIITVAQETTAGAGDFDTHVLGTIRAWQTGGTPDQFYNFVGCQYSGAAITPIEGRVHTFFADTANGLCLFHIHDAPGGSGGHAECRISQAPRLASAADEHHQEYRLPGGPGYYWHYCGFSGFRLDEWDLNWTAPCNAGLARWPFIGSWTVTDEFIENIVGFHDGFCDSTPRTPDTYPVQGLIEWAAYSSQGAAIPLTLTLGRNVRFTPCNAPDGPRSTVVCAGSPVQLVVTPGGTSPFTYQWRKNGATLSGQSANTLSINSTATTDSGLYDCIVTNACGTVTTFAATLTVLVAGSGDGNGDGMTNTLDIQGLVNTLIGGGVTSAGGCAYDMNHDGTVDGRDIQLFVAAALH